MSHVKHIITIQQVTRLKVTQLLNITELQHGSLVMDAAYVYLQSMMGDYISRDELASNELFWRWWRNHWHDADAEFIEACKQMVVGDDGMRQRNQAERDQLYDAMHNPLQFNYTPHKSILTDACKPKKLIKHTL